MEETQSEKKKKLLLRRNMTEPEVLAEEISAGLQDINLRSNLLKVKAFELHKFKDYYINTTQKINTRPI